MSDKNVEGWRLIPSHMGKASEWTGDPLARPSLAMLAIGRILKRIARTYFG